MSRAAASKPPPAPKASPWLSPRFLLAVIGILALALVGLGVAIPLIAGGSSAASIKSCRTSDDPSCTLREPIHEHADFALFIRGKRFDFNQPQFVTEEGKERSIVAHIHPPRFTVVHVHISKTTWSEFLESLGFKLVDPSTIEGITEAQTCLTLPDGQKPCSNATEKLRFIVNGVTVDGVAATDLHDLDRVLIAYGSENDEQLKALYAQVTDEACIPSERCKSRIPVGEPPEACTGKGVCTK